MSQNNVEFRGSKFASLGTEIQFLASPKEAGQELGLIAGAIPVGAFAPLHSHASPETICVLEGSVDVYTEGDGWRHVDAGEVISIPANSKHALRNSGTVAMKSVFTTDADLFGYFKEVCEPFPLSLTPQWTEQLGKVFAVNEKYGYWLGTPSDNAAIGLELPKPPEQ